MSLGDITHVDLSLSLFFTLSLCMILMFKFHCRRWIQAVFSNTMPDYAKSIKEAYILTPEGNNKNVNHSTNSQNITAIDMSESIIQLFDVSPSIDEVIFPPKFIIVPVMPSSSS